MFHDFVSNFWNILKLFFFIFTFLYLSQNKRLSKNYAKSFFFQLKGSFILHYLEIFFYLFVFSTVLSYEEEAKNSLLITLSNDLHKLSILISGKTLKPLLNKVSKLGR